MAHIRADRTRANVTKGEARRAAILTAAREAFLEKGFEATTLDDVIRRSGGSRATIYQTFGDKEGLFAAIVADLCEGIAAPLDISKGKPREVLLSLARAYMAVLMAPENLGLYRLVVAEGRRFPQLAEGVFAAGPQALTRRLGGLLGSELKARIFLEMVKGDLHTRALFGLKPPSPREVDATVREAVRIFCDGLALQ